MVAIKSTWQQDKDAEARKRAKLEQLIKEKTTPVNDWTFTHSKSTTQDGTDLDEKIDKSRNKILAADRRRERIIEHNKSKKKHHKSRLEPESLSDESFAPPIDHKGGYIIEDGDRKVTTKFPNTTNCP